MTKIEIIVDDTKDELEKLKKENEELKKKLAEANLDIFFNALEEKASKMGSDWLEIEVTPEDEEDEDEQQT